MNLRPRLFTKDTEQTRWAALHEGWRELQALFRSMPAITTRDVTFYPTATLSIEMTPPAGLLLVKLVRVDTGASSAASMHWVPNGNRVDVYGLGGLTNVQWRATFLVIGG